MSHRPESYKVLEQKGLGTGELPLSTIFGKMDISLELTEVPTTQDIDKSYFLFFKGCLDNQVASTQVDFLNAESHTHPRQGAQLAGMAFFFPSPRANTTLYQIMDLF